MTGKELKEIIKELEKENKDFDNLNIVMGDSQVEYVSSIGELSIRRLEVESEDEIFKGKFFYSYDDVEKGKRFLIFEYD